MPAASAYAAAVAAPERRGRALSVIYVGVTLATVLGVPLGVLVGGQLGWRASLAGVAAITALTIVGVARAVAPGHRGQAATLGQRLAAARRPEVLGALALTVLALTGTFVVYTYLAPFLRLGIGWDGARVATVLFLFGTGGAVGNVLGGVAADRVSSRRLLSAILGGLALVFALLSVAVRALPAASAAPAVVGLVLLWGIVGWAYPSVQQARLVRLDPGLAAVTLSLNASATYLGISLGAFAGAVAIAHGGVLGTGWLACGCELLGLALPRVVPAAGSERALPGPSAITPGLESWAARGEHG